MTTTTTMIPALAFDRQQHIIDSLLVDLLADYDGAARDENEVAAREIALEVAQGQALVEYLEANPSLQDYVLGYFSRPLAA
jgi:hypothetical protein